MSNIEERLQRAAGTLESPRRVTPPPFSTVRRRGRHRRELLGATGTVIALIAVAGALALRAGTHDDNIVVSTRSSTSQTTVARTTPSSTITSSPGQTAPVTSAPKVRTCQAALLSPAIHYPSGAMGHGGETVVLTNRSATSCSLGGYPKVGLLDHARTVSLTVQRQTAAGFLYRYVPPNLVTLAPGADASFGVEWINQATVAATTLIITPPNDTATIQIAIPTYEVPDTDAVTVTAIAPGAKAGGYTGQGN
jgi:hypothetical protein